MTPERRLERLERLARLLEPTGDAIDYRRVLYDRLMRVRESFVASESTWQHHDPALLVAAYLDATERLEVNPADAESGAISWVVGQLLAALRLAEDDLAAGRRQLARSSRIPLMSPRDYSVMDLVVLADTR